jgi:hypothetical protein
VVERLNIMTMNEKIEAATKKFVADVMFAFCNHAMLHFREEYLSLLPRGATPQGPSGVKRKRGGWPKGKKRGPKKVVQAATPKKRGRPAGAKNKAKK